MQTEKEYVIGREIQGLRCESVGEYSLPDYNGDVKKLLAVKTKVFPTGKFVGDESLEFSGTVAYEVAYLDSENNTTHFEFSTDYDAALKINAETYVDSNVRSSVSWCNIRLVGPRKLSVKCALDSDVTISEKRVYSIDGDAFAEYEPEVLRTHANIYTPSFASGEPREFSEELLSLDGAIQDEVEVLLGDCGFELSSLDVGDDNVTVKGDIILSALVRNAELEPKYVSKRIAYSEELGVADATTFSSMDAYVEFSAFKVGVSPLDDGVSVSVTCTAVPKVCGRKNESVSLITNAYVKERGTENEYSDFSYTEHICSETKTESFDGEYPTSELGIENPVDVIYSEGQARVEKCDISGSSVNVSGEVRFNGIMCQSVEENVTCHPFKFALPFSKNVNINCQIHDNMRVNCAVNATDIKINIDESNAHVTANLDFFITVNADRRQRCLGASYLTDEEFTKDASVITVYYPEAGETLFSIAERFHTSVASIAESNRLSESVFASSSEPIGLHGVSKLLIK